MTFYPTELPQRLRTDETPERVSWKITSFRERFMEIFCHYWHEDDPDYNTRGAQNTIDVRYVNGVIHLLDEYWLKYDQTDDDYRTFTDAERKCYKDCLALFRDFHGYIRMRRHMNQKEKSLWSGRIIKKMWNDGFICDLVIDFFEYYNRPFDRTCKDYMSSDRWYVGTTDSTDSETDSEDGSESETEVWEDQQGDTGPVPPQYDGDGMPPPFQDEPPQYEE